MAKLDTNYLNQIRQTLYNRQSAPNKRNDPSQSNKPVKKQNEEPLKSTFSQYDAKKSTSKDITLLNPGKVKNIVSKKEPGSGGSDGRFIKNRVSSHLNSCTSNETVSVISKNVSPSLSNSCVSEDLGVKKNGRKRLLSSDSPKLTVKRKNNVQKAELKQNFNESLKNSSTSKNIGQGKSKNKKMKNLENNSTSPNNECDINCETLVVSSHKSPVLNENTKRSNKTIKKCLRINPLIELNEATCNFDTTENTQESFSLHTEAANELKKIDNALSFKASKKAKRQGLKDIPSKHKKNQNKITGLNLVYPISHANELVQKKKLENESITPNNECDINCETLVSLVKSPNLNQTTKTSTTTRKKCLRINPLTELNEATHNFDTLENTEENPSVNTKSVNQLKKIDYTSFSFKASRKIKKQGLKDIPLKRKKNRNKNIGLNLVYPISNELVLKEVKCSDSIEEAADYFDSSKITVTRLKFDRFCSLFSASHNENLQRPNTMFNIPRKHFKISQNDEFDTVICDTLDTELGIKDVIHNRSADSDQNKNVENKMSVDCVDPIVQNGYVDTIATNMTNIEEVMNVDDLLHSEQSHMTSSQNIIDTTLNPLKVISLKNGDKILVLEHFNQTVHFHGLCCLKVLNGNIEILGASLSRDSGERKVYSPRGTALLYIRNSSKLYIDDKIQLKALVPKGQLNGEDNLTFQQHCAIVLCKKLVEPYIDFIEEHISQKILPEKIHFGSRVMFELSGNWNKTLDSDMWEDILENVSDESKVVICGGKAVGKSTFLRYSVNMLLRRFKKIRIVDLDPGQSELYPPGCVSVVTLDEEILGPNYTHLQVADRAMLSHINMGHNVKHYIKLVKHLLDSHVLIETLPTLINLPGFTQGIGPDIAINILKLLQPTLLLEIKSKSQSKNYKMDMTPDNVNNHILKIKILGFEEIYSGNTLNYEYVKFNSLSENNDAWSLEARQARELCILSYLGKMMAGDVRDITHFGIDMYCIKISALTVSNHEGKTISPLAINSSLVALCSHLCSPDLNAFSLFTTYGYGFVRGIDLETDTLVLLTPESIETLGNVTHLVLGSVTTPPSLNMSASGVKGRIPYVNVGDLVDLGQLTKRSYLPPKK